MTVFDRIKKLADQQGKSLNKVEEELGLSKNVLYRMKNSDNPTKDRLEILANYFGVSVDYLLGRTDNPITATNTEKNELTVEEALKSVMSYDGKPLTENDRDVLAGIIEAYLAKTKK